MSTTDESTEKANDAVGAVKRSAPPDIVVVELTDLQLAALAPLFNRAREEAEDLDKGKGIIIAQPRQGAFTNRLGFIFIGHKFAEGIQALIKVATRDANYYHFDPDGRRIAP